MRDLLIQEVILPIIFFYKRLAIFFSELGGNVALFMLSFESGPVMEGVQSFLDQLNCFEISLTKED